MKSVRAILTVLALAAAPSALAKGPWYEGTFAGDYPVYGNGKISVVFEANEPKKLTIDAGTNEFSVSELTLVHDTYLEYDWSFISKLSGQSANGNPFEARLVAGQGMAEAAVLILPSGVQVKLVRQH